MCALDPQDSGEHARPWVAALARGGYGVLAVQERLAALSDLVHLVLDAPSVRACLDARLEEGLRLRRRKWDDNRVRRTEMQCAGALPLRCQGLCVVDARLEEGLRLRRHKRGINRV